MKVILDIKDSMALHLLEVLKGLSFVKIKTISDEKALQLGDITHQMEFVANEHNDDYSNDKEMTLSTHMVSEKSLAKDWLSKEDSRWDEIL